MSASQKSFLGSWKKKIKSRAEGLGRWQELMDRRELYRAKGYTRDGMWAQADLDLFPDEGLAPEEAFEGARESDVITGSMAHRHLVKQRASADLPVPATLEAITSVPEVNSVENLDLVVLPDCPEEVKIPPLQTLSWVISELGRLDPDMPYSDQVRSRRQALARAPSYQARWFLNQACSDDKFKDKIFDAWKSTLPSRQQIESSEKLKDDGRGEIEFAQRCADSLSEKVNARESDD